MTTDLNLYKGREQTLVKHEIFGRYLQRFACIVGSRWDSITYVDCFSGPWEQRSSDFRDTSFGIAIKHLLEARDAVAKLNPGRRLKIRCFFVEKDRAAHLLLEQHAAKHRTADIDIVTFKGEFEQAIPQIIKYVQDGGPNTFPFFFIDPTGWTGFAMESLTPIIKLPRVEVMVNFMTAFLGRFLKTDATIPPLYGRDVRPELRPFEGADLEDAAVGAYAAELKRRGNFRHAVPAIILKSGDDRTHFHLVYATRNQKGLEVFKEAERAATGVMNKIRAEVKIERAEGPQGLFWDAVEVEPKTLTHFENLRYRYTSRARDRVRALLMRNVETPYDTAWEEAVQWTPLVWSGDFKEWLKKWTQDGAIEVPTLVAGKRVPQLGGGHILRRTTTPLA